MSYKKITLALLLSTQVGFAQLKDYSSDVSSPASIIKALYEVISGAADQPRDWNRFQFLFAANARLIPTQKNKEGKTIYRSITPAEYQTLFTKNISGFYERELSNKTESYGNIVHVFSTYETRLEKNGAVADRGINSIQLFFDGSRYYVMTIFWSAESQGFPLPEKYLGN
jgi:hypothetical protein